jgi:hypothetical protein
MINSRRMMWAGHVVHRGEKTNAHDFDGKARRKEIARKT